MVQKTNFLKFFLIFWITIFLTIITQIFVKIGEKFFFDCTVVQKWSEKVRNFFSPILMKFCVVTVKNMVIQNIKKKFKIFHFSDHFLTVCANAHCDKQNFLGNFFIFNKNYLVQIWGSSECEFKSWFLVAKLKMGVWQFWPQGGVTHKTDMPTTYHAQR